MKLFSSKRRVLVAAAIFLLLLFLLRPGASRLKSRIIASLSSGVGRPVDIGSVHFRLLPRPGFDLESLVVYDDPAFGAEPMLRASEVTAALRLTSLLRGRLEIARLDLSEPSLNLVHGENGRWNLEALLERTAHIPLAPTAKAKTEPRPGFPYIQGTSARINFKTGPEKKPYALTNADFSLWQDSENAWGVRLKAQPVRTDLNLNDTGVLRVNGTWQRADALHDTPLEFSLEWDRPQLGQLTKLFTGNDQGWRGGVLLDAKATGTPAKLQISANASIQDFRRYDIASGQPLRLAGHCDGFYSSTDHVIHEVLCRAPVSTGMITLKGELGPAGSGNYGLMLSAEDVPASAMLALAQRAKKNLPEDLTAAGSLRGSFSMEKSGGSAVRLEGQGEIADFQAASATYKAEIGAATVPFRLIGGDTSALKNQAAHARDQGLRAPPGPHLDFGPFPAGSGRAVARGFINRTGYNLSLAGETEIVKVLRVARLFGIPALQTTADGAAQLDLQVAGSWPAWSGESRFSGPQVTGTAKLRNVRIAVRGAGAPLEILSAEVQLLPDRVRVEKLSAKAADATWTGSLEMPRGCGTPEVCEIHFNLNANQIALGTLNEWARPHPNERPWYNVLQSSAQTAPSFLASVRASGRTTADRLLTQNVVATHVSANVSLVGGILKMADLNADVLGGKHHGAWQADFSVKPAVCSGSGSLTGISLARLAEAMKDPWIAGTASVTYQVSSSVQSATEFWPEAEGTLQFDVNDGTLPHIVLAEDEGPLRIAKLSGQARLHGGKIELHDAKLDSPGGKFLLSGNYSLKRDLDLKLARTSLGATSGFNITGTVAEPRVTPLAGTEQARLKPEPAK
ncbi:MAG TPA: AsmA family protein [Candidatus Sulfotelmatobacter sp.]|nr:AsmA family protein [Candidatus Sulfotelmatobacter sp.]